MFCRKVCGRKRNAWWTSIVAVLIDESKFSKRKYNLEKRVEGLKEGRTNVVWL